MVVGRLFRVFAVTAALGFVAVAAMAQGENFITNADFEDDLWDPWVSYGPVTEDISKKADAHTGNAAMMATIPEAGANFWDAGIQYKPDIFFAKDTDYTWAMFMKADVDIEVNIKPELGMDPWTAYGEKRAQLTGEYQEFFTEFNVGGADVVPASLTLHVQFGKAVIWLDDARWY